MTLLIQNIQGDIKSHMLMNYNLSTANFEDSATRVEDYLVTTTGMSTSTIQENRLQDYRSRTRRRNHGHHGENRIGSTGKESTTMARTKEAKDS
eukprot:3896056-Amphidinium_carterae.1